MSLICFCFLTTYIFFKYRILQQEDEKFALLLNVSDYGTTGKHAISKLGGKIEWNDHISWITLEKNIEDCQRVASCDEKHPLNLPKIKNTKTFSTYSNLVILTEKCLTVKIMVEKLINTLFLFLLLNLPCQS